jgi:hypothetical protein
MDTLHIARPSELPGRADHAPCNRLRERLAITKRRLGAVWLVILLAGCQAAPVPPASNPFAQADRPRLAVGDTWVYRVSNGYNNEVRGQIRYQVESVDAGRTVVSATPDPPSLGQAYTVVYTKEGNWLRHPVASHGQSVEYEFASAYPAYVFPLQPGKSWSLRVTATDTAMKRLNSVRVDGTVLGAERIRVPAGEFDTIRIRRLVYAGDADGFKEETRIYETDWYAPALGRPVRTESKSEWRDMAHCTKGCPYFRGDWNVIELVTAGTPKP